MSDSKQEKKQFSDFGFGMVDKASVNLYLRLKGFTYAEFSVYTYIVLNAQDQDLGNGKKGYCYRKKTRIKKELQIGATKLDEAIAKLETLMLIETREVPNYRGGHEITEFKPLPLPSIAEFLRLHGELLADEDKRELTEKLRKKNGEEPVETISHSDEVDDIINWF